MSSSETILSNDFAAAEVDAMLSTSEAGHLNTEGLPQYGEEVDVRDWFAGFCMMFTAENVTQAREEEQTPPKRARRGRPRGSRKVYQVLVCQTGLLPN